MFHASRDEKHIRCLAGNTFPVAVEHGRAAGYNIQFVLLVRLLGVEVFGRKQLHRHRTVLHHRREGLCSFLGQLILSPDEGRMSRSHKLLS